MANLQNKVKQFNGLYDRFMAGCDSLEDFKAWDKEKNGEMESYFTNDLLGVILKLIAADGKITYGEVSFINDVFGFDYTIDGVKEMYELSKDIVSETYASNFVDGVNTLKGINESLAEIYLQMFELLTEIIAESDATVTAVELDLISQIKKML